MSERFADECIPTDYRLLSTDYFSPSPRNERETARNTFAVVEAAAQARSVRARRVGVAARRARLQLRRARRSERRGQRRRPAPRLRREAATAPPARPTLGRVGLP